MCAFQSVGGLFVALLLALLPLISSAGIGRIFSDSLMAMADLSFIRNYLYALVFFLIGAFVGVSFKFVRRIKRLFLLRHNGYCVERDKREVSVYLADYAEYKDDTEKLMIGMIPNSCLIERRGKKLLAFYLLAEALDKNSIYRGPLVRTQIGGQDFYKIDLGGGGQPERYGCDCELICDRDRQPELVRLYLD